MQIMILIELVQTRFPETIDPDHNFDKVNGVGKDDGMELVIRREHD